MGARTARKKGVREKERKKEEGGCVWHALYISETGYSNETCTNGGRLGQEGRERRRKGW